MAAMVELRCRSNFYYDRRSLRSCGLRSTICHRVQRDTQAPVLRACGGVADDNCVAPTTTRSPRSQNNKFPKNKIPNTYCFCSPDTHTNKGFQLRSCLISQKQRFASRIVRYYPSVAVTPATLLASQQQ